MEWLNSELDEISDEELAEAINNKKIVVFGASSRIMPYIRIWDKEKCIIIDSNSELDGKLFHDLVIHNLDFLDELDMENLVVISAIKNYTYISEMMKKYHISEFYIQKYLAVNQYKKKFLINNEFYEMNRDILNKEKFDFIDFIYDGKFVVNVIETIKSKSDINRHLVIVHYVNELNSDDFYQVWEFYKEIQKKYKNLVIINDLYTRNIQLLNEQLLNILMNSKRIVFHSGIISSALGGFIKRHIDKFRERTYFIVHGGELSWNTVNNLSHDIFSDIGNIVVDNKEYFARLNNLYHFKNDINFIANSFLFYDNGMAIKKKDRNVTTKNILIGHSATRAIDHIRAFQLLKKYKNENIKVICPLSYEREDVYVNEVIVKGRHTFGEKFIAIHEYMDMEHYNRLLSEIDVGIFPLTKDCGWTTIYSLLKGGRKIYITPINNYKRVFRYDVRVFDVDELEESSFEDFIDNSDGIGNQKKVQEYIDQSERNSFSWSKLYSDEVEIYT